LKRAILPSIPGYCLEALQWKSTERFENQSILLLNF
jgi:hypothetical protein